jgi:hypothetical protein
MVNFVRGFLISCAVWRPHHSAPSDYAPQAEDLRHACLVTTWSATVIERDAPWLLQKRSFRPRSICRLPGSESLVPNGRLLFMLAKGGPKFR